MFSGLWLLFFSASGGCVAGSGMFFWGGVGWVGITLPGLRVAFPGLGCCCYGSGES